VTGPVVVVGDALLDVDVVGEVRRSSPDSGVPVLDVTGETVRPGGAGLAAVLLAGRDDAPPTTPVTLVTALADDGPADQLRALLSPALRLVAGPAAGGTAVKRRWATPDRPLLRTDSGQSRPAPRFGAAVGTGLRAALLGAGAVLVADYGRGVAADRTVRDALAEAVARGAQHFAGGPRGAGPGGDAAEAVGRRLLQRWSCAAVAVTAGARGAVLVRAGRVPVHVPAPAAAGGDPCGAGDAFAGALARGLAAGNPLEAAALTAAETAARFVGAGGAGTVRWTGRAFRQPAVDGARAVPAVAAP
jgi:D-beta-D-heptose 7-phosphate kinase/D-beta-D-heptose 1-phosphate adenosyltransferase